MRIQIEFGRSRTCHSSTTKQDLEEMENRIMATAKELLAIANEAKASLIAIAAAQIEVITELGKVATETDGLNAKIIELQKAVDSQTNPSPELVDAFLAVREQIGVVQAGLGNVKAATDLVDEKVPDAATPPPPAPEPTPAPAPEPGPATDTTQPS